MTECMSSPAQRPSRVALDALGFAFRSASACLGFGLLFWNEVRVFLPAPAFLLRYRDGAAGVAGERSRVEGGRPRDGDAMETQAPRADLAAATDQIHVLTGALDEMEFRLYCDMCKLRPGNFASRLSSCTCPANQRFRSARDRRHGAYRARGGEEGGGEESEGEGGGEGDGVELTEPRDTTM